MTFAGVRWIELRAFLTNPLHTPSTAVAEIQRRMDDRMAIL